jgi:ATP-dependent RNA helicase RhlE
MPFSSFGLHPDILRGVKDLAFTRPTPIQAEAIPAAMTGRDLLACAMTGSGKTAAFILPTIHRFMQKRIRGPRALVLTPTRELAAQIHEHLLAMAVHTPITGEPVFGGVGMPRQEHAFRSGVDIIIATPGRLLDHMNQRQDYVSFANLEVLILDEADRMLDMGFLPDIKRILKGVPTKRQTLFFSATMPPEIRQLTQEMLKDPINIQIERQTAPAVGITQAIYPVPAHLKSPLLLELLQNEGLESVICFTRTKHRADKVAEFLKRSGVGCAPIHGNRSQNQRTLALAGFKAGRFRVLVATDIAARGIDIPAVSHVINYDCPHLVEDYIHRIGRTGRAEMTGDAFTFVSPEEEHDLRKIERAVNKRLPRVTLPDFEYDVAAPKRGDGGPQRERKPQLPSEYGNYPPRPKEFKTKSFSDSAPHTSAPRSDSRPPRDAAPRSGGGDFNRRDSRPPERRFDRAPERRPERAPERSAERPPERGTGHGPNYGRSPAGPGERKAHSFGRPYNANSGGPRATQPGNASRGGYTGPGGQPTGEGYRRTGLPGKGNSSGGPPNRSGPFGARHPGKRYTQKPRFNGPAGSR